jgi:hypothetical protein
MSRLILTFETLFQVLAADKLLRKRDVACRPTPTPPGLSTAVCGVSLELLEQSQREDAVTKLTAENLPPTGVHDIN